MDESLIDVELGSSTGVVRHRGRARLRGVATSFVALQRWTRLLPGSLRFGHVTQDLKDDLQWLTKDRNRDKLAELGNTEGVAYILRTNLKTGIGWPLDEMKDTQSFKQRIEWDLQGRRQTFGVNACNFNARPTNRRLLWQAFMEAVCSDIWVPLYALCGIILSVLSGVVDDELSMLTDGLVFLCFLIIDTVISICVCYWQSKALLDLWMRQDQFQVQVIRFGIRWLTSSCDIVVGDIVELRAGDKTPADGLLIEGYSLQTSIEEHEGPVMFLASGTIVHNGFGTMLVTAVNNGTHQSFYECATADTPLLKHLKSLRSLVSKLQIYVSVLFMLLFFPFYFLGLYSSAPSGKYLAGQTRPISVIYSIVYEFYNSLTLIEVVVPEGLFLMVPLALHYVLSRMTARHVSTCNLSSCESTLGSITTICTGKFGVITQNVVTVESFWIAGHVCNEIQTENQLLDTISESIQSVLSQAIA